MTKTHTNFKGKRGFTLTEIAIVLGIIGLILGAIWTAASRVYANQKVNKAVTEVLAIANAVKSTYGSRGYVTNTAGQDLTAAGIQFGWFPSDMLQSGGNPISPWGSGTVFHVIGNTSLAGATAAANQFEIYINAVNQQTDAGTSVPPSSCPAFFAALYQQAVPANLTYMYSNIGGGQAVTSITGITDTHITNCAGDVVLSFTL